MHYIYIVILVATASPGGRTCAWDQFACSEGGYVGCVYQSWVCDGEQDCQHGEDERNCKSQYQVPPSLPTCSQTIILFTLHCSLRLRLTKLQLRLVQPIQL